MTDDENGSKSGSDGSQDRPASLQASKDYSVAASVKGAKKASTPDQGESGEDSSNE